MTVNISRTKTRTTKLDKLICILSVAVVWFFPYLPTLFIFERINVDRIIGYIFLLAITIPTLLFRKYVSQTITSKNTLLLTFPYIIFSIYATITYLFRPENVNDTLYLQTIAIINPICIGLALFNKEHKGYVLYVIFSLTLVYFLSATLAFLSGRISLGVTGFQTIFPWLTLSAYQNINQFLAIFAIVSYGISLKTRHYKIFIRICIGMTYLYMLFIGGRASLISLTLILFYAIFNDFISRKKYILITFTGFILATITLIFFWGQLFNLLITTNTFSRIFFLFDSPVEDSSKRIFLFSQAILMFTSSLKNFMLGGGMSSYPEYISAISTFKTYPHNIILELLAEYGIIGTFLFSVPIISIFRSRIIKFGSLYGNTWDEKTVWLLGMFLWVNGMFTGALQSSWILIFFTYLMLPPLIFKVATLNSQKYRPKAINNLPSTL